VQGPGKSRNLLGSDADGRHDADADAKICASAHLYNCKKNVPTVFFAISSQHVTVMNTYSTIDATICMVSNCWLSLYLNIAGLQQSPGKIASGVLESPGKVQDFFF